jgi:hypothetical protein
LAWTAFVQVPFGKLACINENRRSSQSYPRRGPATEQGTLVALVKKTVRERTPGGLSAAMPLLACRGNNPGPGIFWIAVAFHPGCSAIVTSLDSTGSGHCGVARE